ncbi:MAG: lactate dehydrogenase [Bacteroidota bacterium]
MKAVAYNIKPFEKEFLAKANEKKHDITLIANALSIDTANYAEGKDAVIVCDNDDLSAPVIKKLAELGIKYIVTRSITTDHIDKVAAGIYRINFSNIPLYPQHTAMLPQAQQAIANQTIKNLDVWQANTFMGDACRLC